MSTPTALSPSAKGPADLPPLFRRIDWLTFLFTFAAVWIGYALAKRIRSNNGGDAVSGDLAKAVERDNSESIQKLENALDILRRARSRSNP